MAVPKDGNTLAIHIEDLPVLGAGQDGEVGAWLFKIGTLSSTPQALGHKGKVKYRGG